MHPMQEMIRKIRTLLMLCLWCSIFTLGCAKEKNEIHRNPTEEQQTEEKQTEEIQIQEQRTEEKQTEEMQSAKGQEPKIEDMDWSGYFDGQNGAAVFYLPWEDKYQIYNMELAQTRRSPCSTFKIVSALVGMEKGVISRESSTKKWSGEQFWKEEWNKDIDFKEAFQTSCVWYFRQVIDELGQDHMKAALDKLSYGNCDISDWEGHLNNNNNNPALTGFWIESSLKISPKEQVEVMNRIFEGDMGYTFDTLESLKEAMYVTEQDTSGFPVYGKTGTGKMSGVTVDSWFTGYVETEQGNVYFCVYLGQSEEGEISGARARDIALSLIRDKL